MKHGSPRLGETLGFDLDDGAGPRVASARFRVRRKQIAHAKLSFTIRPSTPAMTTRIGSLWKISRDSPSPSSCRSLRRTPS